MMEREPRMIRERSARVVVLIVRIGRPPTVGESDVVYDASVY
jgi:hypothetical protein